MIFNVGAGGGASTADKVKYNNTESGLQSDNVQDAVDELNNSLVKFIEYMGYNPDNMPLIPVMKSNTTPSGVASASSAITGYEAYRAFDGTSNRWNSASGDKTPYLQYEFPSAVKATSLELYSLSNVPTYNFTLKGSNDGSTWTDLHSGSLGTSITEYKFSNNNYYKYYRCVLSGMLDDTAYTLTTMQLYGKL